MTKIILSDNSLLIRIEIMPLIVTVLDLWQVHTMSCHLVQVTILQIEVVKDIEI